MAEPVTLELPSKIPLVYVISPVVEMVLPVVNAAAVPDKVPVMTFALKFPLASRATMAEAVFASVAVVALLLKFVILDPSPTNAFAVMVPETVALEAVNPALKAKEVPDAAPNTGVTSVGLFDKTTLPVPVDEVTPVPP